MGGGESLKTLEIQSSKLSATPRWVCILRSLLCTAQRTKSPTVSALHTKSPTVWCPVYKEPYCVVCPGSTCAWPLQTTLICPGDQQHQSDQASSEKAIFREGGTTLQAIERLEMNRSPSPAAIQKGTTIYVSEGCRQASAGTRLANTLAVQI